MENVGVDAARQDGGSIVAPPQTLPQARADFVDLSQVQITCVPHKYYKRIYGGIYQNLSEIPWEEDPLAFSL